VQERVHGHMPTSFSFFPASHSRQRRMGEGIERACLYGWLLDQQWWGGSSTRCWRIIISVPSAFMINASGSSISGNWELIRLFAADSGVKDVNEYNTHRFYLSKFVPNMVNQYPYPSMGRRSSHTHTCVGKRVPAGLPYSHILLKNINIFSISTKIIINNSTQEQYL
jgi:hypothetical protein